MTSLEELVRGLDAALSVSSASLARALASDSDANPYAHAYGYLVASITAHLENARR